MGCQGQLQDILSHPYSSLSMCICCSVLRFRESNRRGRPDLHCVLVCKAWWLKCSSDVCHDLLQVGCSADLGLFGCFNYCFPTTALLRKHCGEGIPLQLCGLYFFSSASNQEERQHGSSISPAMPWTVLLERRQAVLPASSCFAGVKLFCRRQAVLPGESDHSCPG